ncbi:MAG: carbapenam-3-carboxylate synthase domain-containing protein, partial [Vicingaceae bacterium]
MCGIVGIIKNEQVSKLEIKQLKSANERLSMRGPDNSGLKTFDKVALAHRRLSIIDTSAAANQPFQDESKRYTLVFNGEIYNFKSIRKKLEESSYSFRSKSDTEVLLKAYMHFGAAFLNQLDGFFALAIYDRETEETLLARDRFGIKPLLYSKTENQLIFGSEMKALMCFDIDKE